MNALIMATIRLSAGRRRAAPPRARPYFTDADRARASDPFARLGLAWGATSTEIKDAYRRLARELHPDVSSLDPTVASGEFRLVREAYDVLTSKRGGGVGATADSLEEWSFRTWRSGDIIAQERTDVAGAARKRPVRPAAGSRGGGGPRPAQRHPSPERAPPLPLVGRGWGWGLRQDCRFGSIQSPKAMAAAAIDRPAA